MSSVSSPYSCTGGGGGGGGEETYDISDYERGETPEW